MKFKKKPIIVEAIQTSVALEKAKTNPKDLPIWMEAAWEAGTLTFCAESILIYARHGEVTADLTDWIIKGPDAGDIYPCAVETFWNTYEQVI